MKTNIIIWFLLAAAVFGDGLDSHAPSQKLLSRDPIRLTGGGRVELSFEDAVGILDRKDLLAAIQRGYSAVLPKGKTPEFTVTQTGPGTYHYVNRHGQETAVEQVSLETVSGEHAEIALYSEGRRFFGNYQSLCCVTVTPAGEGQVDYSVTVYARPESAAVRIFARLTPAELYFRHKLKEMTGLVIDVCNQIKECEPAEKAHVASSS
ncbi:hypothetical protein [Tichowtungia aerotolerans]|uniref:Uncharacterized protein n=1 Tax=Tichowtungia aerotolerans TaxID=2697043 RepID=A0A6P1MBW0_9BACT|nr:hypothetical protein [Tichowtungia aerotolerans]QHI70034.1 hypothetical protein GT409_11435 [Tichowtungia aerotolerans]